MTHLARFECFSEENVLFPKLLSWKSIGYMTFFEPTDIS